MVLPSSRWNRVVASTPGNHRLMPKRQVQSPDAAADLALRRSGGGKGHAEKGRGEEYGGTLS
jgi:hypothetical protein